MMDQKQNAVEQDARSVARIETTVDDTLLKSVAWICKHYKREKSEEALVAGLPKATLLSPSQAMTALENAGITGGMVERRLQDLPEQLMPMILLRQNGGGCIVLSRRIHTNEDNQRELRFQLIMPEVSDKAVEMSLAELNEIYAGFAVMAKPAAVLDERASEMLPEVKGHWLFSTLWRYRRYYRSAAIAAVLINVLALSSIFFTMNVYDRVVPNQAFVTLWSLAIGVTIAMILKPLPALCGHICWTWRAKRPTWCWAACCSVRRCRSRWSTNRPHQALSPTRSVNTNRCVILLPRRRWRRFRICRLS